ncbi:MAG: hypothetical protein MUF55_01310 [Hydrogenophaga sp.]|jgi:hypothetical protein|nr:hypothetical protein [Hydrogenophaga sp.]
MVTARRKRQAPPGPPSLPGPAEMLALGWRCLDEQHAHDRPIWLHRTWVNGDRRSEFLTFELGLDLRLRVYSSSTGRILAESDESRPPPQSSRESLAAMARRLAASIPAREVTPEEMLRRFALIYGTSWAWDQDLQMALSLRSLRVHLGRAAVQDWLLNPNRRSVLAAQLDLSPRAASAVRRAGTIR